MREMREVAGEVGTKERMPREWALEVARQVMAALRPLCEEVDVAGSLRRGKEMVGDVDLVVIPKGHETNGTNGTNEADRSWERMKALWGTPVAAGDKLIRFCEAFYIEGVGLKRCAVDIYRATWANLGMVLVVRTGSAEHNVHLAQVAQRQGLKFAAGTGVLDSQGNVIGARTEEEVFGAVGLEWITPGEREGRAQTGQRNGTDVTNETNGGER